MYGSTVIDKETYSGYITVFLSRKNEFLYKNISGKIIMTMVKYDIVKLFLKIIISEIYFLAF